MLLDLALSPSGHLRLAASDTAIDVEPARLERLTQAFERGSGPGLVQLGGAEIAGELPPALGWFRDFGRLFFTALCALPDLDLPGAVSAAPPAPNFEDLARSAAPMLGGEYLNAAVLESLWGATWDALCARASERRESVIELVRGLSSAWQSVGRVVFHLAENKRDLRLRELCEPIAERQERVLVFTQFRELCDPLAGFLKGVFGRDGLTLHGGTAVKARSRLVEQFQTEDGPPFFVLSLKAGGTETLGEGRC